MDRLWLNWFLIYENGPWLTISNLELLKKICSTHSDPYSTFKFNCGKLVSDPYIYEDGRVFKRKLSFFKWSEKRFYWMNLYSIALKQSLSKFHHWTENSQADTVRLHTVYSRCCKKKSMFERIRKCKISVNLGTLNVKINERRTCWKWSRRFSRSRAACFKDEHIY